MDLKGIYIIDYIFTIFLIIMTITISLNLLDNNISDEKEVEIYLNARSLIDSIANTINSVNSNNIGNIGEITLPNNILSTSYFITVNENEVVISLPSRKGESSIHQIRLANLNGEIINEIRLYPGVSYKVKKSLNEYNLTIIQIYNI